jgi:hypothetical protein
VAVRDLRDPPKEPNGVRLAATIKMLVIVSFVLVLFDVLTMKFMRAAVE